MLWWSVLLCQATVSLAAVKKGVIVPSKLSLSEQLNEPFDDDVDDSYPFIPGVDQEVAFFGHPSFSVARAHSSTRHCLQHSNGPFQPCVIRYENHLPPLGRHFDRRLGLFVCNVPGLYYFSFAALSSAFSSCRLSLTKNDHEVVSAYGAAIGNQMAFNSALLLLRAGDRVCVKLLEGQVYESDNRLRAYTTFTGFMVHNVFSNGPPPPPPHPFGGPFNAFGPSGGTAPLEAGPRLDSDDHNNQTLS